MINGEMLVTVTVTMPNGKRIDQNLLVDIRREGRLRPINLCDSPSMVAFSNEKLIGGKGHLEMLQSRNSFISEMSQSIAKAITQGIETEDTFNGWGKDD